MKTKAKVCCTYFNGYFFVWGGARVGMVDVRVRGVEGVLEL